MGANAPRASDLVREGEQSDPRKMPAARKCLSCFTLFESEWIGNRLCDTCLMREGEKVKRSRK